MRGKKHRWRKIRVLKWSGKHIHSIGLVLWIYYFWVVLKQLTLDTCYWILFAYIPLHWNLTWNQFSAFFSSQQVYGKLSTLSCMPIQFPGCCWLIPYGFPFSCNRNVNESLDYFIEIWNLTGKKVSVAWRQIGNKSIILSTF